MSRRAKEEYQRHYSVTEPRSHPKGYTEYKVTAKFVSRVNPEDVKEIVVWRRYSDFKKLHGDLAYTHRNLFRRLEDFPSFPKAQVFGRFEPEVIEERRKAAEAMLRFTVHIPALNNSPQLKEFFRGGEGQRPLEKYDLPSLPPPLVPVPPSEGVEPGEDALRSVDEQGPPLHSEQRSCRVAEAASEECGDWEPKPKEEGSPSSPMKCDDDKALDALFAFGEEEEEEEGERAMGSPSCCPLSVQELALFDPFSKEEPGAPCPSHEEDLAALPASGHRAAPGAGAGQVAKEGASVSDPGAYLPLATEHIRQALEGEAAKDYQGAFCSYRSGVDLLLQGLQVDPDAARREAVKKKTAEYLQRAEEIFQQHLKHLNL
ncbi:sorting nexin-15 isoform X2 [Rhineura floridana]|uniref:sorting nexin-15 isoform X2 n=1 Tax=Rhineura floridana TaxID=261503 RepID=UPI002AC7EB98|nr:sorting nexin-15 isoform X2 [Rhineura floridana]